MRTFGKEWYKISNNPIPTVLMNGSQLGFIVQHDDGTFHYEELDAFPLTKKEILDVMGIINNFLSDKVNELLVFYYPRDWKKGEIIWTPLSENIENVRTKYKSASQVFSCDASLLEEKLLKEDICMIFLLINLPQDKLMAYQHTKKNNFFTRQGVDKLSGAERIASLLDFELAHSLGAGDSEMDTFLKGVAQAVHVGNPFLEYQGTLPPIKLQGSAALGDLLFTLSALQKNLIH
jgi:hydroxymethylpyrimidine pyrophosphatase-like HAD family hydrolase